MASATLTKPAAKGGSFLLESAQPGDVFTPADLSDDQKLIGQLTSIRYYHDSSNRMLVESKDVLKKRGLKSPDRAEALMLSYTVDRPVGEGMTFDRLMEEAIGGTILPNFMDKQF